MKTVDAAGVEIGDEHPPRVMGVLNYSPESAHHDSTHSSVDGAVSHIEDVLAPSGADIVEIGLRSTSMYGDVPVAVELERLEEAVEVIETADADVVYSVETRHSSVADEALHRGFDMVNDVCGFADPEMPNVCDDHDAAVVKMASGDDLETPGAISGMDAALDALRDGGLTDKTILDPGFGAWYDGKTVEDDQERFRRLREFRQLDRPIAVAVERKEFVLDLLRSGRSRARSGTISAVATALAVNRGANLIRAHDVAGASSAALMADGFDGPSVQASPAQPAGSD